MDFFISKKRGVFLTLVIFLESVGIIQSLFTNPVSQGTLPSWIILHPFTIKLIWALIYLFLFWEIWFWKKWAIYAILIMNLIASIYVYFLVSSVSHFTSLSIVVAIIVLALVFLFHNGIFYWAVRRKWKYFS